MYCENCGKPLPDGANLCESCGAKAVKAPDSTGQQNEAQHYTSQQPIKQGKAKRKHGCLTSLLVFICILGIAALALSFLLPGFFNPHDLGIKSSKGEYEIALAQLKLAKDEAPITGSEKDYQISYGKAQAVQTSLDSEEITSFFNENRPDYYALKNVQIRINPDNTLEAAATMNTSYIFDEILSGKYSREDANKVLPMLGLLPDKINLYCKLSGSIINNQTEDLNIQNVSVMGIPIPKNIIGSPEASQFIESTLDNYIEKTAEKSGASYDLLQVSDGKLQLEGKLPSSISRIPVR